MLAPCNTVRSGSWPFTLPRNSAKIAPWTAHKGDAGGRTKGESLSLADLDSKANPRFDTYAIDLDKCGPMVLDALCSSKLRMRSTLRE